MKGPSLLVLPLLFHSLAQEVHGFVSLQHSNNNGIHWQQQVLQARNRDVNLNEITQEVFHDEFASLVESHPLDDPEPSLPERPRSPSFQSSSKIPSGPHEEWKWFYSKLRERNMNQEKSVGTSSSLLTKDIMEESLLREWMAQQRKAFMKSLGVLDLNDKANWGTPYLTRKQKELLDTVNFPWGHLQPATLTNAIVFSEEFQRRVRLAYKDWQWNEWYERLRGFASQHGHTCVPVDGDDTDLASWTAEQRAIRRKMPKRRRERLDELQFDWNWKDTSSEGDGEQGPVSKEETKEKKAQKVPFSRRVKELKEFRTMNGNCDVPVEYKGGLGEWAERMKGRRSKLSPSSIAKLEAIGLVFTDDVEEEE